MGIAVMNGIAFDATKQRIISLRKCHLDMCEKQTCVGYIRNHEPSNDNNSVISDCDRCLALKTRCTKMIVATFLEKLRRHFIYAAAEADATDRFDALDPLAGWPERHEQTGVGTQQSPVDSNPLSSANDKYAHRLPYSKDTEH
ncbi:hypothetical protein HGP17_28295 [Rhizobium sp. P38BS-XIX]|uniref:hypothetical protein n=1 Tax=Rhizobium sp. P38BS-XIX TaxID=2726740 RepID=UPI00145747C8|nr:hypothetical protein [Rhizobium sp. P38BS-XIX]NLS00749.1 hypothetical protein [Rhizobium sp. P38BS-XIX]